MAVSWERWQAALRGLSLLHHSVLLGTKSRQSCLGKSQKPVLLLLWRIFCPGQGEEPNLAGSRSGSSSQSPRSHSMRLLLLSFTASLQRRFSSFLLEALLCPSRKFLFCFS